MKGNKVITQVTFDAVVKENVSDFGMNFADAIRDAVSQFEAQSVDLSNIVTKVEVEGDAPDAIALPSERASSLVESLKTLARDARADLDDLSKELVDVKQECDIDLAHRCLIGSCGLAEVLFDVCKTYDSNREIVSKALSSLGALTNGQPDVITTEHVRYFCQQIRHREDDPEVLCSILKLLYNCCVKHEGNRQATVDNGLIELVIKLLQQHKSEADLVKQSCAALRVLTFDDDIRVMYGKAHDHAKKIVTEHAGIDVLLGLTKDAAYDIEVNIELLTALSSLAVRNEFCQEIVDQGGLDFVVKTFLENIENQRMVQRCLTLMKTIAGNDKVKGEIVKAGGVQLILLAMNKHQADAQLCVAACTCLAVLALRVPPNCEAIMEAGGANSIVTAMRIHKDVVAVQKSACQAVRNLVSRTKDYGQNFLECGVEALINEARKQHPETEDYAKDALRDLGCKVELQERWTGQKGSIGN